MVNGQIHIDDEVTQLFRRHGLGGAPRTRQLDFRDLMRYRINNILLVASLYDYYESKYQRRCQGPKYYL